MPDLYRLSDKTIATLNKQAIKRFREARAKAGLLHIDELNILTAVSSLYEALKRDAANAYTVLAYNAYLAAEPHGSTPPDRAWTTALLREYDPVLLWIWWNECDRKKQRAQEAIIAAKDKKHEWDKALRLWTRTTAWESDNVAYKATVKAFKDAGVKRVRWVTAGDEKVCDTCGPMDGEVFEIDKIPPKPHQNCRCRLAPVK